MPVTALRTAKDTVQLELAGRSPAVSVRLVAPAPITAGTKPVHPAGTTVIAPPVATRLAGKLSVSPGLARLTADVLSLVRTIERVLSVLGATADGANDFATRTFEKSVALAAAILLTFCVSVSAPMGSVLVYGPGAVMVTLTVTVHEPVAGIVAPASVN